MRNLKPDGFIPSGIALLKLRREENKFAETSELIFGELFEKVDIEHHHGFGFMLGIFSSWVIFLFSWKICVLLPRNLWNL